VINRELGEIRRRREFGGENLGGTGAGYLVAAEPAFLRCAVRDRQQVESHGVEYGCAKFVATNGRSSQGTKERNLVCVTIGQGQGAVSRTGSASSGGGRAISHENSSVLISDIHDVGR